MDMLELLFEEMELHMQNGQSLYKLGRVTEARLSYDRARNCIRLAWSYGLMDEEHVETFINLLNENEEVSYELSHYGN